MNIYRDLLIWILIFNLIEYILMIHEWDMYLTGIKDCLENNYNLSTHGKDIRCIGLWFSFTLFFPPLMYYYYHYVINPKVAVIVLPLTMMMMYVFWDFFPLFMTNNGFKIKNLFSFCWDFIVCGLVWVIISLYLYHKFRNNISDTWIVILCIANVLAMMLFFYEFYIFNRKGTQHNWLVNLGDRLGLDNIMPYFRLKNPF